MKRDIYKHLINWKAQTVENLWFSEGPRQVGKTYILKEFGKNEYENVAYFNFEEDPGLNDFF